MNLESLKEVKRLFIPTSFDLEKLIENNPPVFEYRKDFFYYLVHLMYEVRLWNEDIQNSEYVPLKSTKLQEKRHDYRRYLDYLIDYGVLDEDSRYVPDLFSKGFKLLPPYSDCELMPVEISNKNLIKKLTRSNNLDEQTREKYWYLYKWLIDEKFVLDSEAALHYSKQAYESDLAHGLETALLKHNLRQLKIDKFQFQKRRFKPDHVGRVHTNLTGMDKGLRNFLSYAGNRIVEVDIGNAQPLFSLEVLKEIYPDINLNQYYYYHPTNTIMLVDSVETAADRDLYEYIKLVANAALYAHLIKLFEQNEGIRCFKRGATLDDKKKRIKDIVFGAFFSENNQPFTGKEMLYNSFPCVFSAFEKVKAYQHNTLALKLQKIESEIVIDTACKNIATAYPNLPLFPIHDSISTVEGNQDIVKEFLSAAIEQRIGLVPPLKTKIWCPDCLDNKMAA